MKTLLQLGAVAMAIVAFSSGAPVPEASEDSSIELACKARGTECRTSFECCSQNCQTVNGKGACH